MQEAFKNARRLNDGEKLELVDQLYTCSVDESTGVVTVTITANLADVVRSSKGNNFIVPLANTKGVRGGGVITATSENGLMCKLYADRLYLSTPEAEKEKQEKASKSTTKAELEEIRKENAELKALMMEFLKKNK